MASTVKTLETVLTDLKNGEGVESALIATRDGLLIAANVPPEINAETFSAMCATMIGAAEIATVDFGKGTPKTIVVELDHGRMVATDSGQNILLVVLTAHDAKLGLTLVRLEKCASKVKEILQ